MQQPTLYRFRDHRGHLLYVGRSVQPRTRIPSHQIRGWWTHVARIDLEHFATADELAAAEAEAIAAERPRFNVQLRNGTSRSTFLDDVTEAVGAAGWIWNKDLLPALQAKRPEEYGDWDALRLGTTLRQFGLPPQQVNRRVNGEWHNHRGVVLRKPPRAAPRRERCEA